MELQAALQSLHLYSPAPLEAARFYRDTYGMALIPAGGGAGTDTYVCHAPGRQLMLSTGPANQLNCAHFAFHDNAAWMPFSARFEGRAQEPMPAALGLLDPTGSAVSLRDPDGNKIVFTGPAYSDMAAPSGLPPARLQHFALRTPQIDAMLDFYVRELGFVLSDAVRDEGGVLRACFLRSNCLHHALALFFAPAACFDHQSFEAPDWASMLVWGDHMAKRRVPIVWGIGRHGPGNDVFFMVRDPDGNLAEISAEIEHCEPGRPTGLWPHEERTLNLWGKAILRS
jgi:catechol 2,3-dioxygenase